MAAKAVSVHEAKTHLSRLLARVRAGESVIIAHSGTPVARLVPFTMPAGPRQPGTDEVVLHAGFDALPKRLGRHFGQK